MRLVQTDALVLHAFDYRETSRIVRLSTREHGVVSAVARGARKSTARFGDGMDLFTSGIAQLAMHPTRDLHALNAFDTTRVRAELASGIARFMAAAAMAEVALRFAREEDSGQVHALLTDRLDQLCGAQMEVAPWIALQGVWQVVAALGFAPELGQCASCHRELAPDQSVPFHHRAGGSLCDSCARTHPGGRVLPSDARAALGALLDGRTAAGNGVGARTAVTLRAHQRLLREFLEEHVGDGRPLRAFAAWEQQGVKGASSALRGATGDVVASAALLASP